MSTPVSSNLKSEKRVCHNQSSGTSSWVSDVSVSAIFKSYLVNMISTSHMEDEVEEGTKEMIQSDSDPWIKHLKTLWDIHFKQRKLPTVDKVVHITLGDEANPNLSS